MTTAANSGQVTREEALCSPDSSFKVHQEMCTVMHGISIESTWGKQEVREGERNDTDTYVVDK